MLRAYCAQTLSLLLTLLPEVAGLVTGQDDLFEVTLTTPAGWRFWLRSDEVDYLSVGLTGYHGHFGHFVGITPEQDAADAAAFIQSLQVGALVAGRTIVPRN